MTLRELHQYCVEKANQYPELANEIDTFYDLAEMEFAGMVYTWRQWEKTKGESGEAVANEEMRLSAIGGKVIIKDAIADNFLANAFAKNFLRPTYASKLSSSNAIMSVAEIISLVAFIIAACVEEL